MTDITELAQSLKRRAASANEFGESLYVKADNVLALVEALEKAQQRIAETESSGIASGILRCTECSFVQTKNIISVTADTITTGNSEPEPCPNGCGRLQPVIWKALAIQLMFTTKQGVSDLLEAKKRIAEQEEAEQKLCAANVTLDARAELAERQLAELESRTVTVKLPTEVYTIGELIRTQDNRITDQPMFVVFQKREIIGSDEHSPSRICWVWDGEEVSELRARRLEALYQDGRDTRGYDRYAMQEVDEFVTACFTEHGCKEYLRQNGHNLRLPYIYACGSFRNNEYQLVRNWLAGIKVEAE